MTIRYYQFSGINLAISMPEELFFEKDLRLEPFRAEGPETDWIFHYEKTEELLPPVGEKVPGEFVHLVYNDMDCCTRYIDAYNDNWKKASARVEYRGKHVFVQLRRARFPSRAPVKYVLTCMGAEHLVARNNGFVFHCSYIEYNGQAILFTAPSGTGKSTQAELWKRYRGAEIINGDRAAVRLVDNVLLAEGIPFAGSSEYCENRSLPVAAIVYLGQAPKTAVHRLHGYEAFSRIWEGVSVDTWDREDLDRVSYVVQKTVESVPVYYLPCTPDETAVTVLEEALRKQVNYEA